MFNYKLKNNKYKTKILLITSGVYLLFIIYSLFFCSSPVHAQKYHMPDPEVKIPTVTLTAPTPCPDNPNETCYPWISQYIAGIYKYGIGIIGILATIVMMIGGVVYITSGGSPGRVGEAKAWIGASLTGLVLMLTSHMILSYVNPNMIKFGSGIKVAKVEIKEKEVVDEGGGNGGGEGDTGPSSGYLSVSSYAESLRELSDRLYSEGEITGTEHADITDVIDESEDTAITTENASGITFSLKSSAFTELRDGLGQIGDVLNNIDNNIVVPPNSLPGLTSLFGWSLGDGIGGLIETVNANPGLSGLGEGINAFGSINDTMSTANTLLGGGGITLGDFNFTSNWLSGGLGADLSGFINAAETGPASVFQIGSFSADGVGLFTSGTDIMRDGLSFLGSGGITPVDYSNTANWLSDDFYTGFSDFTDAAATGPATIFSTSFLADSADIFDSGIGLASDALSLLSTNAIASTDFTHTTNWLSDDFYTGFSDFTDAAATGPATIFSTSFLADSADIFDSGLRTISDGISYLDQGSITPSDFRGLTDIFNIAYLGFDDFTDAVSGNESLFLPNLTLGTDGFSKAFSAFDSAFDSYASGDTNYFPEVSNWFDIALPSIGSFSLDAGANPVVLDNDIVNDIFWSFTASAELINNSIDDFADPLDFSSFTDTIIGFSETTETLGDAAASGNFTSPLAEQMTETIKSSAESSILSGVVLIQEHLNQIIVKLDEIEQNLQDAEQIAIDKYNDVITESEAADALADEIDEFLAAEGDIQQEIKDDPGLTVCDFAGQSCTLYGGNQFTIGMCNTSLACMPSVTVLNINEIGCCAGTGICVNTSRDECDNAGGSWNGNMECIAGTTCLLR